ncbi:TBC1 domain family member 2B-like [Limulus polyphemus]|uniref:TBC1 domain family member 2B-like n=1 Tax=Limulus polyphemus TaxID=6850 RepID=A0ABM1TA59_LIMPO|nr:TBC1 domain family member 2B-like [Limulus polyphemus]XP_022252764.1 TBC1 domain family member 2B-like [Limulus polyphemus]XP_022252765.1 TBC1 domain family member 2B-like [Limulus polyphemus]XP_022252766.1 TBC1 domain family member 2B-like [Limulus polyphemus]
MSMNDDCCLVDYEKVQYRSKPACSTYEETADKPVYSIVHPGDQKCSKSYINQEKARSASSTSSEEKYYICRTYSSGSNNSYSSEPNNVVQQKPQNDNSKLCGYLNKLGSRGLLKSFKRRWFVFSENSCKLYYYRAPEDLLPLGEIDISKATLSFDVSPEKPGLFTVSTPEKEYILEAKDRNTCLFWLQELQKWRRHFSLKRTQQIQEKTSMSEADRPSRPESGLLAHSSHEQSPENEDNNDLSVVCPIRKPEGGFQKNSFSQSSIHRPLLLAQSTYNNLRNQVVSSVAAIRNHRQQQTDRSDCYAVQEGISTADANLCPVTSSPKSSLQVDTAASSSHDAVSVSSSSSGSKSPSLNAICSKIQGSFRIKKSHSFKEKYVSSRKSGDFESSCAKCKELSVQMMSLKDDLVTVEDELFASREVIKVLHKELDAAFMEKDTCSRLNRGTTQEKYLQLLNEKDQQLVNLTHDYRAQQQDMEIIHQKVTGLESEVEELKERVKLYQELLQEKDKVVMSLTNEIFELETKKRHQEKQSQLQPSGPNGATNDNVKKIISSVLVDSQELDELRDARQAYELQNKFLNKEILEVNQLLRDSEERENKLTVKSGEWEARAYQIQSKLLFLLKELERPFEGENTQEVVKRLLREAMHEGNFSGALFSPEENRSAEYDEFGFNWKWGKEEDLVSTKAANLQQKSQDITSRIKDPDIIAWREKWENFMANQGGRELQRSPELKMLVRSGIPPHFRGRVWKGCINLLVRNIRQRQGSDYYKKLLSISTGTARLDPAAKQIELDLLRTLPNNKHYESLDASGVAPLRRVLLAYSRHNPAVGYCQGINRLAAIALLFMEEEEAFWCLVAIVEYIMPPDYYSKTLLASQVDQRVLKDLLSEKLPRLHNHLEQCNVDLSLFTFNWFLTVYVDNIPVETYLHIWDVFLFEGSKVLFRFALAFFKICENDLLQLTDYMAVNRYLRNVSEKIIDYKRLAQVAFNDLNPFPMRMINSKRAQHVQIVKAQLEELEALRSNFPVYDEEVYTKGDLSPSDED